MLIIWVRSPPPALLFPPESHPCSQVTFPSPKWSYSCCYLSLLAHMLAALVQQCPEPSHCAQPASGCLQVERKQREVGEIQTEYHTELAKVVALKLT